MYSWLFQQIERWQSLSDFYPLLHIAVQEQTLVCLANGSTSVVLPTRRAPKSMITFLPFKSLDSLIRLIYVCTCVTLYKNICFFCKVHYTKNRDNLYSYPVSVYRQNTPLRLSSPRSA